VIWLLMGHDTPKVTSNVTVCYSAYDFLFDFNGNYASTLYSFRVLASYLSKVADFNLSHMHLSLSLGDLFQFCQDLWHHKTRVYNGLSFGVLCFIQSRAVSYL